MGQRDTISGHIQEAWYVPGTERQLRWLRESNSRVVRSLPRADPWPPLYRRMFSFSPEESGGGNGNADLDGYPTSTYRGRVIYFGGSFSSLYREWDQWLDKFEGLLRRLYWEHAVVVLETGGMGHYVYRWDASRDRDAIIDNFTFKSAPAPVRSWTFTGGPRSFTSTSGSPD